MTDHAELRRLAEAATPGPWTLYVPEDYQGPEELPGYGVECAEGRAIVWGALEPETGCQFDRDAEFIAAANPNTILALLDEIDQLKAENEVLRGALKPFAEFERVRSAMGGNAPREGILYGVHSNTGSAELHVEHMQAAQSSLEGATQ